jgi:hypothetical protein
MVKRASRKVVSSFYLFSCLRCSFFSLAHGHMHTDGKPLCCSPSVRNNIGNVMRFRKSRGKQTILFSRYVSADCGWSRFGGMENITNSSVHCGSQVVVVFCPAVRARSRAIDVAPIPRSRLALLQERRENQLATSTSPRSEVRVAGSTSVGRMSSRSRCRHRADPDVPPHELTGRCSRCVSLRWAGWLL